jgi:hypothetical protein
VTQALKEQLTAKKLRGLNCKKAMQDVVKQLSNIKKVLLTEPKVGETL